MRTNVQDSGGTAGACDGTFTLDWDGFQLAHPGALGAPWLVGTSAFVQCSFRDPASCQGRTLSNAVELVYQP
jgi:hypothetical protein